MASLLLFPSARPAQEADEFHYREVNLEGWTVLIQEELEAQAELSADVQRLLSVKLWEVSSRLPADVVERLQEVKIRMHLDREGCSGGVYHPSAAWLKNHDFPTDWARGVEFGNARNFLSWERTQPAMVLHELSHAWHHQVLGYERQDIVAALAKTRAAKTLEDVLYVTGGRRRAYGLNNVMEYFAEMSEAWWATNDFYPFVRAEVQEDFPEAAAFLKGCWQVPR